MLLKSLQASALLLWMAQPVLGEQQSPEVTDLLAAADRAWVERSEGRAGARASEEAVRRCAEPALRALELAPDSLEARWRVARALYFEGEFLASDSDSRLEIFSRGRELVEESLDLLARTAGGREALDDLPPQQLAERLGDRPSAARLYFWGAVHWGLWGRYVGKMTAARQGVAGTIRDYAEAVVALDPDLEEAGGHRMLGRLHSEAPKLPFFTGWIDRQKAIAELEAAVEHAPDYMYNQVYLAEAHLGTKKGDRARALAMLREVVERTPTGPNAVEEAFLIEQARATLAEETAD